MPLWACLLSCRWPRLCGEAQVIDGLGMGIEPGDRSEDGWSLGSNHECVGWSFVRTLLSLFICRSAGSTQ
jgi:hypothetical protein